MHSLIAIILFHQLVIVVNTLFPPRKHGLLRRCGLGDVGRPMSPLMISAHTTSAARRRIIRTSVSLPLDHWDTHSSMFDNRMWISDLNYKPGGPVFIWDIGEGDAEGYELFMVGDTLLANLLKRFNGMGIIWEHRYYGTSTPVPINTTTSALDFRFLTTEQALADVAAMAWNFSRPEYPEQDLTPRGTPWIFIGGSYSGMRAAFMRQFYPGTIFASWASSAPVQSSVDMSFYWDVVWYGLNNYGWGNCSRDIRATVRAIDTLLENPVTAAQVKDKFLGSGSSANSNGRFVEVLATIASNFQDYGVEGEIGSLRSFCDWIATDPTTNSISPAEGWAPTKGTNFTMMRWITWPEFSITVNLNANTNCTGPAGGSPPDSALIQFATAKGLFGPFTRVDCDLDAATAVPDLISWMWQSCTQWGFLQYANVGAHQLVGAWADRQFLLKTCQRQFPDGVTSGLLPDIPASDLTNSQFGGWNIRPSQTFWTAGEFDPWRILSPLSDLTYAPKIAHTTSIPRCAGRAPSVNEPIEYYNTYQDKEDSQSEYGDGDALFSFIVPNSSHCYDLDTSPRGQHGAPARKLFVDALSKWLPCFQPGLYSAGEQSRTDRSTVISRALYP